MPQPVQEKDVLRVPESPVLRSKPDVYLGWTLFKGADDQQTGLRTEKGRLVRVKHQAETYVIGIPEDYADAKSKSNVVLMIYDLHNGSVYLKSWHIKFIREISFVLDYLNLVDEIHLKNTSAKLFAFLGLVMQL